MANQLGAMHHLSLCVTDLEKSRKFYDAVLPYLGYQKSVPMKESRDFYFYPGKSTSIGIWPADEDKKHIKQQMYTPGLHHFALTAETREQVDGFHRHLKDLGITILDAPADYDYLPGYYAVFFEDPDGIRVELVHTPGFPPG